MQAEYWFQSLIGIKLNCNVFPAGTVAGDIEFQSLIGIKLNCNYVRAGTNTTYAIVSIPNRD